jgi:hypothetical protein
MKKIFALVCGAGALVFAAVAWAGYFNGPLPPNHHIHDCTTTPPTSCTYPHLPVGFFPTILDESRGDYLKDPAECNDATDKALLPPNDGTTPTENQPLRAGVCYTSTTVIHMRSINANDGAPAGWSGPIAPVSLGNGVTYVTYWRLTPR